MKDIIIKKLSELQSNTSDFNPILYEILSIIIHHLPSEQTNEIYTTLLSQINTNIQAKSNIDSIVGLLINISLFPIAEEKDYYSIFDYLQEQERVIFNGILLLYSYLYLESTNPILYLSIFLLPITQYDTISKYISLYSNLISNSMKNEITSYSIL